MNYVHTHKKNTHRLADQWVSAGSDLASISLVLADLPLANLSALRVLVSCVCACVCAYVHVCERVYVCACVHVHMCVCA